LERDEIRLHYSGFIIFAANEARGKAKKDERIKKIVREDYAKVAKKEQLCIKHQSLRNRTSIISARVF
jgi:hypothetical protein